jgi:hypothetical protein
MADHVVSHHHPMVSWSMPKRSRKESGDYNVNAARIVALATGQEPPKPPARKKNPHAVALGRKGGKVGGKARAAALTPKERHLIAVKAARARWGMNEEG